MALVFKGGYGCWDAGVVDGYPWLFIGSLSDAEYHEGLQANNITRVLTVASRLSIASLPDGIDHLQVDIDDHPNANFLDVVEKCSAFIDAAAADNREGSEHCSILVHCASGVSRSVSAVLAWLMDAQRGFTLDEAFDAVRKNRPFVKPNLGFMSQLRVLEKHNGNIHHAIKDWSNVSIRALTELLIERRALANDLHSEADKLEDKIQTFRSSLVSRHNAMSTNTSTIPETNNLASTRASLLREANFLSDQLDTASHENLEGSAVDMVTKVILKSARSKIERLISLLEEFGTQMLP